MSKILLPIATIAALAAGSLSAYASDPSVGYGGTIGALAVETHGIPTTPAEVRAQGGFATAGAVHWIKVPAAKGRAVSY